jgi:hypothetical protein
LPNKCRGAAALWLRLVPFILLRTSAMPPICFSTPSALVCLSAGFWHRRLHDWLHAKPDHEDVGSLVYIPCGTCVSPSQAAGLQCLDALDSIHALIDPLGFCYPQVHWPPVTCLNFFSRTVDRLSAKHKHERNTPYVSVIIGQYKIVYCN